MKSLLSSILLCILLSQSEKSFAQFENIDINKFKLTDFKYSTLDIGLNANNSNLNRTDNFISSKNNATYYNLNSSGNVRYTSTVYNRKYNGIQSVGFGFSSHIANNNSNIAFGGPVSNDKYTFEAVSSNSNLSLSFSSNNRFYMYNDYYFGINFQTINTPIHASVKSETNNNSTFYKNSTISNTVNSNNSASFYFGKGRYENVTDARLAIYILDALAKQGRLSRIPTQEEVFAFAEFITKTLNKRVIDNRIKKIKEFVAVDSFLVSNGLTIKTDGLYFGLINDNWEYGRTQYWGTGSSWHFGVSPSLTYSSNFSKSTDTSAISKNWKRLNQYNISFDAGYGTSWISGLKWIKGYDFSASFNIFKLDSTGYFNDAQNYTSIIGNARYNIGYIPNTRTSLTCSAGIRINKNLNKDTFDELRISPFISGSCNYYFSEKLRLQVNSNLNYNYNKIYELTTTQKTFSFEINATLNYFIF